MLNLVIIQNQNNLTINLKQGKKTIDHESLTIARNLDTLLIIALDNILSRNTIDKLLLRVLRIQGKVREKTVSGMIIKTVKAGLRV